MKKLLICFTILMSFIGINRVSAAGLTLSSDVSYDVYKDLITDDFNIIVNDLINEYKENFVVLNPYFDIALSFGNTSSFEENGSFLIELNYYDELPSFYWQYGESPSIGISQIWLRRDVSGQIRHYYHVYQNGEYVLDKLIEIDDSNVATFSIISLNSISNPKTYRYFPYSYYISNYDLYLPKLSDYTSGFLSDYDNLNIPKLGEDGLYNVVSFDRDDFIIEPYYLYDEDVEVTLPNLTEVNLNDYAFVALSLKDYNQEAFTSTIQVKGEYCVNAVYDYGLSSKEKYDSSITDVCSPYYDNYTPVRHYVLENDIKNHAIYYIKAHDTSKENRIKVDSSIFNVHYVTEEEADNPVININGRDYSILPFDELPTNSIKNTDEGFVPGESEKFSFSDIFTAPLEFLMEIWSTITTFFTLITSFILLLPPVLQGFLYASFTLAIVLGLIKIIL